MHGIVFWFCLSPLAVGPALDPLDGEVVDATDRDALPSGRHLGHIADTWFVNVSNLQATGGGIATFDPLQVSAYGRSWTQMRVLLGGVDVTDPARPGQPLVDLPHGAWSRLRLGSLFTDQPGFEWEIEPAPQVSVKATAGLGGALGGGAWIPRGILNREPAVPGGPDSERRKLRWASELSVDGTYHSATQGPWQSVRVHAEHIDHERTYPALLDDGGSRSDDGSRRATVLAVGRGKLGALPLSTLMLWQAHQRDHRGAEFRWPRTLTAAERSHALILSVGTKAQLDGTLTAQARLGYGYRFDRAQQHGDVPTTVDLLDQWMWMARPTPFGKVRRHQLDGRLDLEAEAGPGRLLLSARSTLGWLNEVSDIVGMRRATTYLQGAPQQQAVSMTVYDAAPPVDLWLSNSRLAASYVLEEGPRGSTLRAYGGLDVGATGADGQTALWHLTPAAGAAGTLRVGRQTLFALARMEPDAITAEAGRFVSPDLASGSHFRWNDDGDLQPEPGEEGTLLGRTGGRYHDVDPDLRRPMSRQIALGWRSSQLGRFRVVFAGVARWLVGRYVVRLADPSPYTPVAFHDPGGDGRGETPSPSGGQDLTLYARQPGGEADERYVLTNARGSDFFLGLQAQLMTVEQDWWFLNLGGVAYLSEGGAPFGSFPDRNDPGIVSEASADPNQQRRQRGRYDHDRAFGINLALGIEPVPGWLGAMVLRYRDGQPFTRVVVDPSLPQGPTAVMAVHRGKPRHTFHMTLDVRLRYARRLGGAAQLAVVADIYNLLGSGTELLEDPRTGATFRDVLEMVPGRAGFLSVEVAFN